MQIQRTDTTLKIPLLYLFKQEKGVVLSQEVLLSTGL